MKLQKYFVSPKNGTQTLLHFVTEKLGLSSKKAKLLLDKRLVFVNKKRVWIASYQLNRGDVIEVLAGEMHPSPLKKPTLLFQDEHLFVVSKQPGITTNGPRSLERELQRFFHNTGIKAVHRLDKDTSGAVIFAMNNDAFQRMKAIFKEKLITKIYRVIVSGRVRESTFTIHSPIQKQRAITYAKTLMLGKTVSYLEVEIPTGRKHQIRIHLASIGHPVIGETEYHRKPISHPQIRQTGRHMLHAYKISFSHPYTHKTITAIAEIPADFNECLKRLCCIKHR